MPLTTSRQILAPAPLLWRLITDTRRWPEWGPSISEVRCSDRVITLGSTGHVIAPGARLILPFTITELDPEALHWSWQVAGLPATTHQVEPTGADACRVRFGLPSPLLFPYLAICQLALARLDQLASRESSSG